MCVRLYALLMVKHRSGIRILPMRTSQDSPLFSLLLTNNFLTIRMYPVFVYLSYCLHQKADGSLITRQYMGSMMMKHGFSDDESKPTYYRSTLQPMHLQRAHTSRLDSTFIHHWNPMCQRGQVTSLKSLRSGQTHKIICFGKAGLIAPCHLPFQG